MRQALRPLIATLQQDPNSSVRASAAEALGKLGGPVAVHALIEELQLPALDIRSEIVAPAAARALGQIGDSSAIPALSRALDGAGDLQFAAVEALRMIKSAAAREILKARDERIAQQCVAKLTDPIASTRVQACLDLHSLKVNSAVGPLVKALTDPESSVRSAAASALAEAGDVAAQAGLLRLLSDSNASVRVAAAEALVRLLPQATAASNSVTSPEASDVLLAALMDKSPRVRAAAAKLLGKWLCPGAVPALMQTLENPGERVEVRVAACAALACFKDAEATEALTNAVVKGLWAGREEVALQFGRRGHGRGNDALLALLRNPKADPTRRVEAIGLLVHFNEQRAVSALRSVARDQAVGVREAAASGLIALKTLAASATQQAKP